MLFTGAREGTQDKCPRYPARDALEARRSGTGGPRAYKEELADEMLLLEDSEGHDDPGRMPAQLRRRAADDGPGNVQLSAEGSKAAPRGRSNPARPSFAEALAMWTLAGRHPGRSAKRAPSRQTRSLPGPSSLQDN
eukprot:CAMPEP_0204127992 /NCGR_PEP_ID=MMETSP0361-20130328/11920_1 /ASSEMBLY_ACC=CAM_ASM_000343 /TAXON_ID=268821 /ORGANISM="Scrippsiella Hangoei, Strain SHTV-5" /LENGTH=135 /DNA_ID=CAMNT_0051080141 /DNA_START=314 /DNA_END=722 /DNA_ORIENTATION=-